jgi:hypothetical protein
MGYSFGQITEPDKFDTIFNDSFQFIIFKNPFKHKSNTWINVPNGYTAFDSSTSIQISGIYGVSLNPNAELITIMVPNPNRLEPNEPYIVVLYYPGFIPSEVKLNNLDKEDIYNALSTEKNGKANVHWLFNDWIIDDTKFDRKRNLFKMNAFYKFDGKYQFDQRQIAYWQFGNKGIYHYVWICPERKIYQYQPPRTELDNLLGVLPSFSYAKHDENFPYSENLTLEDVICMEDLGPTNGVYDEETEFNEESNT